MGKKRLLTILFISILAIVPGCNRPTTVETPDGGKVTVDQQQDQLDVTATGPDGQKVEMKASSSGVALPADFPKDVPILPGAKPTSSTKAMQMTMVSFETAKPITDVFTYYQNALVVDGWEIQAATNTESGAWIGATKKSRTLNVTVGRSDKTTILTLNLGS